MAIQRMDNTRSIPCCNWLTRECPFGGLSHISAHYKVIDASPWRNQSNCRDTATLSFVWPGLKGVEATPQETPTSGAAG
jgi:hypothetical protein